MEEAKAEVAFEVTQAKNELTLNLRTPNGTKLNYDAPWNLKIAKNTKNIKEFDKNSFKAPVGSKNNSATKSTHTLSIPKEAKGKKVDVELRYFICDNAVSWCKPVTHKSSIQL